MQSIHNHRRRAPTTHRTVCDISKIRNVVNSQPAPGIRLPSRHCLRYIKDTKCSQFTTKAEKYELSTKLFAIYQRYEMQSIHNYLFCFKLILLTVCDISKIRNVVNSQPIPFPYRIRRTVCDISKIRNVVNSQHVLAKNVCPNNCLRYIKDTKCSQFTTATLKITTCDGLFAIYQRYEMQSIHNHLVTFIIALKTVCDISKIRNVVNSQPIGLVKSYFLNCLRYIKDTKCSQFTTHPVQFIGWRHCLRYIKDTKCSQFTKRLAYCYLCATILWLYKKYY